MDAYPATAPSSGGGTDRLALVMTSQARVRLAHAVLQTVAGAAGVELLHLKGPALLPGLRPARQQSSDADVLVAPGGLDRLERALSGYGWRRVAGLESGSAFGHATTWSHDEWGYADLHASWPGPTVDEESTFAILGEEAFLHPIAHVPCRVPGRTAQILILLLHAARTANVSDVEYSWHQQGEAQRSEVTRLAERLGAQVPLAAALGDLETYRDDASYSLWRYYREGGSRLDEWRARYRAAGSPAARRRVVLTALRVNRDHLGIRLGRPPTRGDVLRAQAGRMRLLGREIGWYATTRLRRSGR